MTTTAPTSPDAQTLPDPFNVVIPPLSARGVALFKSRTYDTGVLSWDGTGYLGTSGEALIRLDGTLPAGARFTLRDVVGQKESDIYKALRNGIRITSDGDGYATSTAQPTGATLHRFKLDTYPISLPRIAEVIAETTIQPGDTTLDLPDTWREHVALLAPLSNMFYSVHVTQDHVYLLHPSRVVVLGGAVPLDETQPVVALPKPVAQALVDPTREAQVRLTPDGTSIVASGALSVTCRASTISSNIPVVNDAFASKEGAFTFTVSVSDLASAWSPTGLPESMCVLSPLDDTHVVASLVEHRRDSDLSIASDVSVYRSSVIPAAGSVHMGAPIACQSIAEMGVVLGIFHKLGATDVDITVSSDLMTFRSGDMIRVVTLPMASYRIQHVAAILDAHRTVAEVPVDYSAVIPKSILPHVSPRKPGNLIVNEHGVWIEAYVPNTHSMSYHLVSTDLPPVSAWGRSYAQAPEQPSTTIPRSAQVELRGNTWSITCDGSLSAVQFDKTVAFRDDAAKLDMPDDAATVQVSRAALKSALTYITAMQKGLEPDKRGVTMLNCVHVISNGRELQFTGSDGYRAYHATLPLDTAASTGDIDILLDASLTRMILALDADADVVTLRHDDERLRVSTDRATVQVSTSSRWRGFPSGPIRRMFSTKQDILTLSALEARALATRIKAHLAKHPGDIAILNVDTKTWTFQPKDVYIAQHVASNYHTDVPCDAKMAVLCLQAHTGNGDVTVSSTMPQTDAKPLKFASTTDSADIQVVMQPIWKRPPTA